MRYRRTSENPLRAKFVKCENPCERFPVYFRFPSMSDFFETNTKKEHGGFRFLTSYGTPPGPDQLRELREPENYQGVPVRPAGWA